MISTPNGKKIISKVIEILPIIDEKIYKVEFSNGKIWFTTESQWFYCGNDDQACAIDSQGKFAITEDRATANVVKVENTG